MANIADFSPEYITNACAKLAELNANPNATPEEKEAVHALLRPIAESEVDGFTQDFFDTVPAQNQDLADIALWLRQTSMYVSDANIGKLYYAAAGGETPEMWGFTEQDVIDAREHCRVWRLIKQHDPERAASIFEQTEEIRADAAAELAAKTAATQGA